MKELNLISLLKGKKGIKLYSPIFGECTLHSISEEGTTYEIEVLDNNSNNYSFTKEGYYVCKIGNLSPECLLFPCKEEKTWDNFGNRVHKGNDYFYIDINPSGVGVFIRRDDREEWDNNYFYTGNYFSDEEKARECADKINQLFLKNKQQ